MSLFTPTHVEIDAPATGVDPLAGAVLKALGRPMHPKLSWSVVRAFLLGGITVGILPIFSWSKRFGKFVIAEQQQFLHLAKWVRANSEHPLTRRLENDAVELLPRTILTVLSVICAMVPLAGLFVWVRELNVPFDLFWWQRTLFVERPPVVAHWLVQLWALGLGGAYFFHWLQVQLHAMDVKRFVARFSEIARSEGITAVKADSLGTTLRPLWVAGGAMLWTMLGPWTMMMMLAGAGQRRYITWTSRNTRADVAQRLREMVMRRRPASYVPAPVYLRERCVEAKCRAEIPRGVKFCPRCGTRQMANVHRVA